MTVRIALIGMGRMGQAIDALATSRECEIVARLGRTDTVAGMTRETLGNADVAIEFTVPDAAKRNAEACLRAGVPVVIGTTGWSAGADRIRDIVRETSGRALWAPNFSVGVQLFLAIAEEAARRMREHRSFDAHVLELHHAAKKDAPSGTALAIVERLRAGLDRDVPTTSVRTGSIPGTHEAIFDAPFEQIRLVHEARDRRVFADGALTAARFLATHTEPGVYTMRDVVNDVTGEAAS